MPSPICFVNLDSINVTPYFAQYEHCLHGADYDLVYWSRGEHDTPTGAANTYRFDFQVPKKGMAKYARLARGYLGFRRFASKILKRNRYERVVALTGNAGTILATTLKRHYPGRYIIDIRDYFLENLPPYRMAEESAIETAGLAIISSPAYTAFLGEHDFQVMHNIQDLTASDIESVRAKQRPSSPMVLASIGTAKNLEEDRRVISYFANDPRFHLKFIGRGYDALLPFCRENGIRNIEIVGDFPSSDTVKHYRDVDVIISMYGNDLTHVKYQLTNKLYFAVQLRLPIIVSPGTYMDETVSKYGLGFALDVSDESAKERALGLYSPDSLASRNRGAEAFLEQVAHDNDQAMSKIERFLDV